MAPVDLDKLRSHVDFVRANLRRLEAVRGRGRDGFLANEMAPAAATRWLQTAVEAILGIATHVIARETYHTPFAVDHYLLDFARVFFAVHQRGLNPQEAAFTLGRSLSLVKTYLALIEEFGLSEGQIADRVPTALLMRNEQETLSKREGQVLALLADGAANKEIALQLSISERTVKAHVTSIFNKLGAGSRTEAVAIALRCGLLPAEPTA